MSWFGLINMDTIFIFIVICVFVYFLYTTKKKRYPFFGQKYGLAPSKKYKTPKILRRKHKKEKNKRINKHEERCRSIFQSLFNSKFKSVRPAWLKNPVTGRNLELDGYCPEIQTPLGLGLAFEYDGAQHSKFTKHFHKNGVNEFAYQIKKDNFKDLKCKEKGILLIRIPHYIAYPDLDRYIKSQCHRYNLKTALSGTGLYG